MVNLKKLPIIKPLIGLVFSRKFLVLVFAALAAYGLDLEPELQAVIIALGAIVLPITIAWEDAATKRAGGKLASSNGRITWTNERRTLAQLTPWEVNPRQIKEDQAERLAGSFDDFGQVETLAIDPDGEVVNGHQRLNVLRQEYGADYEVDVRVASRKLTTDERKKLTVYLHEGATGEWDFDGLANLFEVEELKEWGFPAWKLDGLGMVDNDDEKQEETENEYSNFPLLGGIPDLLTSSDNVYGIPRLSENYQADFVDAPIVVWGSAKHAYASTFVFYTEDSRFLGLWNKPDTLCNTGCVTVVEPNFSIHDHVPLVAALWQTYKKRMLARYWQTKGIRIIVDLNVPVHYADVNLLGVPVGWGAYATRGYQSDLQALEIEYQTAMSHSGNSDILFLVYGGGEKVKDWTIEHNCIWQPDYMDIVKGKYHEYTNGKAERETD